MAGIAFHTSSPPWTPIEGSANTFPESLLVAGDGHGQHSAQITNVYEIHLWEHFRRCLERTVRVYGVTLAQQTQVVRCAEYFGLKRQGIVLRFP